MNHWSEKLSTLNACIEAVVWCKETASLEEAWAKCHRGDWMLWLTGRITTDRKPVTLATLACARLALPYAEECAEEIEQNIAIVEEWVRGERNDYERDNAIAAIQRIRVVDATTSLNPRLRQPATFAAAYAIVAALSAAYAAIYDTNYAEHAAYAAFTADGAIRNVAHVRCTAEIVRSMLSCPTLDV